MDLRGIEQSMRRVGLVFIVGLLVQVRVDGRQVVLPFLAAAVAWLLRDLHPLVTTPDEKRIWSFLIGCAYVTTALAFAALIPAVAPEGPTVVITVLTIIGTIAYVDLLRSWGAREGWLDVTEHGRRARLFLFASLAVTIILVCLAYGFTDPAPASLDPDRTLLRRDLSTMALVITFVSIFVVWIPAMVSLQLTNRAARRRAAGLADGVAAVAAHREATAAEAADPPASAAEADGA